MDYSLMLAALSSLFWVGSAFEPMVYWAIHPGQRYGLASIEITVDFEACDAICAHYGKSLPCHAFNFRESDGTCQLVYEGGGQLVPAEGFHAFLKCE
ncbi:unnamed protein product [Darwinula stevensoni]|uniref:Apple domain-containing protein n=1 Tax=Darwinula stevensoni TaxID=69355 RepID=A0A7R8XHN9_9CRUS|nr:unnamed protein product [Darwinula stevensoni]CAG0893653.1 unnamed protein product [Darwinula stevensoni]